jgi:hypothetical protein
MDDYVLDRFKLQGRAGLMLVAYAPSDYLEGEVRFYALFGDDLWDELWTRFPRVDDTNGISLWRHVAAHVLGAITLLDSAQAALKKLVASFAAEFAAAAYGEGHTGGGECSGAGYRMAADDLLKKWAALATAASDVALVEGPLCFCPAQDASIKPLGRAANRYRIRTPASAWREVKSLDVAIGGNAGSPTATITVRGGSRRIITYDAINVHQLGVGVGVGGDGDGDDSTPTPTPTYEALTFSEERGGLVGRPFLADWVQCDLVESDRVTAAEWADAVLGSPVFMRAAAWLRLRSHSRPPPPLKSAGCCTSHQWPGWPRTGPDQLVFFVGGGRKKKGVTVSGSEAAAYFLALYRQMGPYWDRDAGIGRTLRVRAANFAAKGKTVGLGSATRTVEDELNATQAVRDLLSRYYLKADKAQHKSAQHLVFCLAQVVVQESAAAKKYAAAKFRPFCRVYRLAPAVKTPTKNAYTVKGKECVLRVPEVAGGSDGAVVVVDVTGRDAEVDVHLARVYAVFTLPANELTVPKSELARFVELELEPGSRHRYKSMVWTG